jgi:hypothetical protein
MKNILAENLLRFGVRNLSKSEVNKIQRLMEQDDEPVQGAPVGSTGQNSMQQFLKLGLPLDAKQKSELIKNNFLTLGSFADIIKNFYNDPGTGAGFINKPLVYRSVGDLITPKINPETGEPVITLGGHAGVNSTNIKITKPVQSVYFGQNNIGEQYCWLWISKQALISIPDLVRIAKENQGLDKVNYKHSIASSRGRQDFAIYPKDAGNKYTPTGYIDWFINSSNDLTTLSPLNFDYQINLKNGEVRQQVNNTSTVVGTIPLSCFNYNGAVGDMHGVEIRK